MEKKPLFTADMFVPTQWSTAEDKAKFANHFMRFVEKGCPSTLFHKWFYIRLSMTFGHIAHFNQYGFYETWFGSRYHQKQFIDHTIRAYVCGDPRYTYSDVEVALQRHLRTWTAKGDTYTLPGVVTI